MELLRIIREAKGMKKYLYHSPFPAKKVRKFIYKSYRRINGKVKVFTQEEIINYCKENGYETLL